ncbi:MAG: hypothetical protein ACT4N4_03125, partial [Rhodospirillales bacterium]
MYRHSNSPRSPQAAAPAPRNSWEQAERILEILERDPIQPPVMQSPSPRAPASAAWPGAFSAPIAARIDEWLRKPLRESNYLRGMGIGPDDPFWDTYADPRLERFKDCLNREGFPKDRVCDSRCWLERRPAKMTRPLSNDLRE